MPRNSRKNLKSFYKHIMVQGIEKKNIFGEEKYMKKYKEIIREKLKESSVNILAYCIMHNHSHFLIYSENPEEISKFMQKVNTTYSIYYNKINNRVGYVFRNRFKSQEILDLRQLYTCLRYIHNNPVKADITKTMQDYKYSSYNEFLSENYQIINNNSIKLLFGDTDDFVPIFKAVHERMNEIEEKTYLDIKSFIEQFQKEYNVKIEDLKYNKGLLKLATKEMKQKTNAKVVEISKILKISKATVYKYLKD